MKVLSLFSGIGGFDIAFQRKGHEIIGACEIDKYARLVYARHFPKVHICEDATKINPEELPDFDILVAGFPCQSFSIAGRRKGFEDTRGTLFFEIARIAQKKRPYHLLLENVKGLLSHEGGNTIRKIYKTLDELGYDTESHIINTKDFLPQNRERIFIVGTLRGERRQEIFPVREDIERNNSTRHQTQEERKRIQNEIAGSIQTSPSKGTSTMIAGAVDANYYKGGGTRTMIATPKLNCLVDNGHSTNRIYDNNIARTLCAIPGGMGGKTGLYAVPVQLANFNSNGRRMKTHEEDMYTLDTSSGHRIFNGKRVRRLTPTECERLQGFSDGYTEGLSDTQRYKCLGNAVTVPVVEYILEKISSTLEKQ